MNERFRQLAEQAKIDYELLPEIAREPVWIALDDELEKFAELIVRECMACSTWVGKVNNNPIEPVHTAQAINQRIQQNFGVEE